MSLPEITALCRVLARSDAYDHGQQQRNLERLRELQSYLGDHADRGTSACIEAATTLVETIARGSRVGRQDLLEIVCKLMATVERHWSGPDPDAVIADVLYAASEESVADPDGVRRIQSSVHRGHVHSLVEADFAEAQARIDRLKRTPRINEMVLGELLVELGHLSWKDLEKALDDQMVKGDLLGDLLVERGLVPRVVVEETVGLQRQLRGERTRVALAEASQPAAAMPASAERTAPSEPRLGLRLDVNARASIGDRARDHQLGAILLRQGGISSEQLEQALSIQRATGLRLGESLVDMEATSWDVIEKAVELQKRLRQVAGIASWRRS